MITVDLSSGLLSGPEIIKIRRTIADLRGVFSNEELRQRMDPSIEVYRVSSFMPVGEGTPGGLFWGSTQIEPGTVGDEYFMTKGHFHERKEFGEFYITVAGSGALILMNEERVCRVEIMSPGTVHYIPGYTAHRVANTGSDTLSFLACWPSDAGHDYESIEKENFSARMRNIDGVPKLVSEVSL
jgi:glucose-6-phosphate isomerase, archaeal